MLARRLRTDSKGFTLIELMIVVGLIGILAAIAVPYFNRIQLRARAGEAKTNLASIRSAQEGFFAEFSSYVACSGTPGAPGTPPGRRRATWTDTGGFRRIGWLPEGDVFYQYGVEVGPAGGPPFDFYTAEAISDIDADLQINAWGYVKPNSAGSTLAGSLAGDPSVDCPRTGVIDRAGDTRRLMTVGPCQFIMGRSIF